MFTAALKSLALLCCLGFCLSVQDCSTYKTQIHSLIENGDVTGLEQAFNFMNSENRSVLMYRLLPIDNTVWPEVSAIKMLISLSRPLLHLIGKTNTWPENNNIRVFQPGPPDVFSPKTSYHGGIRYIYNCETVQTISCTNNAFEYHPNKPILNRYSEDIFVPMDNFMAANGDAMSEHLRWNNPSRSAYIIHGCNRLSLRECGARQVFFNATESAEDCFDDLKFFSLPEVLEARSTTEDTSDPNKYVPQSVSIGKQYFIVMY